MCREKSDSAVKLQGKIAYESDRDGNIEIYLMDDDGSHQTRLTFNESADRHPNISADGTVIAFSSDRDGNWEIYVMHSDGSNQTRLTINETDDDFPRWSPDGLKIAFSSRRSGRDQIYIMNIDGSSARHISKSPAEDGTPSWAPTGDKIVFESNTDGVNENIYSVFTDGSHRESVLLSEEVSGFPDVSSDGKTIVFERNRHDIATVTVDGSTLNVLTDGYQESRHPSWSHNGNKIVFESIESGNWDIYLLDAAGTGLKRLTFEKGSDRFPSWSPARKDKNKSK